MDYSQIIKTSKIQAVLFYKNQYKSDISYQKLIKARLESLYINDNDVIDVIRMEMFNAIHDYKLGILSNEYISRA